jgi:hypothetical protein
MVKLTLKQRITRTVKAEAHMILGIAVLLLILCHEAIADLIIGVL